MKSKKINKSASYEDNNGGDILEIIDNEDGTFTFQTGTSCVYTIIKTGTISEICQFLAEMTFNLPNDYKTID
jgi:hypothetical protein